MYELMRFDNGDGVYAGEDDETGRNVPLDYSEEKRISLEKWLCGRDGVSDIYYSDGRCRVSLDDRCGLDNSRGEYCDGWYRLLGREGFPAQDHWGEDDGAYPGPRLDCEGRRAALMLSEDRST